MFRKKNETHEPAKTEKPVRDLASEVQLAKPFVRPDTLAAVTRQPAEAPRRSPDLPPPLIRRPEPRPESRPEARPVAIPPMPMPASVHDNDGKKLIVGREIVLNGEIRTCDKLVVEGRVEATLTDSRSIEIAGCGLYKGSAEVETADISGRFEGDITVKRRLLIRSSGRVEGTIRYGQLEVESGGIVCGTLELLPRGDAGVEAAPAGRQSDEPGFELARGIPELSLTTNGSGS